MTTRRGRAPWTGRGVDPRPGAGTISGVTRRRLLILSFSPIATDARVLKQVEHFVTRYDVTTCGFGPAPAGVTRHLALPDDTASLTPYGRFVSLRLYRRAYGSIPPVRAAVRALAGEPRFDVVLANDIETVPLALELRPTRGVHVDLHEYAPRLHDENPGWRRWLAPFYRWLCRRYVRRAASVTTVGRGLAEEYRREFGIEAGVVTNAAPFAAFEPVPVRPDAPLRLVHSGAALRNRDLMVMLDAVEQAARPCELDLYLMPNDPAYIAELRARAAGLPGVRVLDPVPYADLVGTLHRYDVGVHVLPPVNFNNTWALPNKFFDYVQARLGLVVGPSAEMAEYVTRFGVGAVAVDFTPASLADVLDRLTPEVVDGYKAAAHAAARELSAEVQVRGWAEAVAALMGAGEL